MEEKKISFAITDISLLDENQDSNFAILSMDFFASGKNSHDMYVEESTLFNTSESIHNCPIVWMYDPIMQDAKSHDPEEIACGVIPENAEIKSRKLEDGRTMLSVTGLIWKKFSGKILEFFYRDGQKPISVEITVFNSSDVRSDGLVELLDYRFEAVTILSNLIKPAIPLAHATVIQFAEEYRHDYELEFGSYETIDFTIPSSVKNNATKGLSFYKQFGRGGNSISLSIARHLQNSEKSNFSKIKHIAKIFSGKRFDNQDKKEPSNSYINFMLYGGKECIEWTKDLIEKINEQDSKNLAYFSKDRNLGKKESDKKLSEKEEEKNMKVEEKDKNKEEEQMATEVKESPEKEEQMASAVVESPEEKVEKKEEDKEKKENPDEKKEEKMSNDANLDVKAMLAMLADETEKYREIAGEFSSEEDDGKEKNFAKLCGFMYEKMCKMSEDNKTYMAENEELRKFKSNVEKEQKEFEVKSTLKEVENSMPKEEMESLYADASNFSLENIGVWQNKVKAKAFSFVKDKKVDAEVNIDIIKMAFPFYSKGNKSSNPWD